MPGFDDLFKQVKQDAQLAGKQIGLASKIAKIKLEISTQKSEKERHLKTIGVKTYAIFAKDNRLDGNVLQAEVSSELNLIQRIDQHIEELQTQIKNLQGQFRTDSGKDIVDADEIKDTSSDR